MLPLVIVLVCATLCGAVPKLNLVSWTPIPDGANRFLPFLGTADRMAFDAQESYLYVIGAESEQLHILDVRDQVNPSIVYSQTFNEITEGVPKAIAFCRSGQRQEVVIAFSSRNPLDEGHVTIFKPWLRFDHTFDVIDRVATESDPSAIKFDSFCTHFVVTCEGLPGTRNNVFEDPIPHVDIFERTVDGYNKITINFIGARGLDKARYIFKDTSNPQHSVLNDLEPSDLVIDDNNRVYITFHENNAIGTFDLNNVGAGVDIYTLGTKDWNNFDIDTSDRDTAVSPGNDNINMVRRNIRSFHQPKRLEYLHFNSETFLLTPNTGGIKTYTQAIQGVDFTEAIRARLMEDSLFDPALDSGTMNDLNNDAQIGRLFISNNRETSDGWDNIFGFFKHAHAYGARSWGMWNAQGVTEVYDSGDELEYQTSLYNKSIFNGDCFGSNNSPPQHLDTRSDDKGIEPSSIATGMFNGQQVVVVGSGRMGGIWLFVVAEGEAPGLPSATFQSYTRIGDINGNWRQLYDNGLAGVQYISDMILTADENNKEILMATCSQLGAVAIFELEDGTFP